MRVLAMKERHSEPNCPHCIMDPHKVRIGVFSLPRLSQGSKSVMNECESCAWYWQIPF